LGEVAPRPGGLKGLFPTLHAGHKGAVGRSTGAYCYSVWMRHLSIVTRAVPSFRPHSVVELGPGDSLGVGCAALLSGAESYVGLDLVPRADPLHAVHVLEGLVCMFGDRAPIPGERDFPHLLPQLPSSSFHNSL